MITQFAPVAGIAASLFALLAASCSAGAREEQVSVPSVQAVPKPPSAVAASAALPAAVAHESHLPKTFVYSGELTQGGWIKGTVPAGTRQLTFNGQHVEIAKDGTFFVAFDRDAGSSGRLVAERRGGPAVARDFTISRRNWKIEHINAARRSSGPSAAFMALRRPELARINAARAIDSGSTGWQQDFIWPIRGRISGRFGSQRIYRGEPGSYHSGIDIATGQSGTPFAAPADGTVILAADKPFTLEGKLLMIDHGNGLNSAFLHCSALLVKEGDRVKQGQLIGRIGATGRATGPHLHWGMKWGRSRIDPILLTGPMPR